jgi:hypothetical protein
MMRAYSNVMSEEDVEAIIVYFKKQAEQPTK